MSVGLLLESDWTEPTRPPERERQRAKDRFICPFLKNKKSFSIKFFHFPSHNHIHKHSETVSLWRQWALSRVLCNCCNKNVFPIKESAHHVFSAKHTSALLHARHSISLIQRLKPHISLHAGALRWSVNIHTFKHTHKHVHRADMRYGASTQIHTCPAQTVYTELEEPGIKRKPYFYGIRVFNAQKEC